LALLLSLPACPQSWADCGNAAVLCMDETFTADTISQIGSVEQSIGTEERVVPAGRQARKKSFFARLFSRMSEIDTAYIEPQAYNFTLMLQNTNTYESYWLRNKQKQSLRFAPRPSVKIGPYFGWRWAFLGYTVDVRHLGSSSGKTEWDFSFYAPFAGIDLYYRRTGSDYTIRSVKLGEGIETKGIKSIPFDGFHAGIKGFNFYYIFNHKRFSYPAAFSQSTIQRRSCGSAIVGIGYCNQHLSIDQNKLVATLRDYLPPDVLPSLGDSAFAVGKVKYTDVSVMGGYAYNWAFAHGWLFSSAYSVALGYKHSTSDMDKQRFRFDDFSFRNISLDGIGRFGLVWNNMRWYAGASLVVHTYTYRKSQFSISNAFGTLNIYFGWNFSRRKQYRQKR